MSHEELLSSYDDILSYQIFIFTDILFKQKNKIFFHFFVSQQLLT
ncbi:hypothetical protein B4088_3155 [Bacillus cereus]|uniref:Uncharacterized protein n=1 Tax=Bacillus cereus TaxID=1396 RepID=A0A164NMP0_BACCE|nr:hypothetical protein B4088_3155 [Bacillus cereus]